MIKDNSSFIQHSSQIEEYLTDKALEMVDADNIEYVRGCIRSGRKAVVSGERVRNCYDRKNALHLIKSCEMAELLLSSANAVQLERAFCGRDINGLTPLHIARDRKIAELFVKYGADINITALSLETPLHTACQLGRKDVVEYLGEKGARINSQDNIEDTPLDKAYIAMASSIAEIQDPHRKAVGCAYDLDDVLEIIKLLKTHGASRNNL